MSRLQELCHKKTYCDNSKDAENVLIESLKSLTKNTTQEQIQFLKNKRDKTDDEIKQLMDLIRKNKL